MRRDAYKLLHDGALALARVEENGIRIDVGRLDRTIVKVKDRIEDLTSRLKETREWKLWRKIYGGKASIGSRSQLGEVLDGLGYHQGEKTSSGKRRSTARGVLEQIDKPFVKLFLDIEKLKKLHGTYLKGLRREVTDGLLHCFYNLHTVKTYRSSSDRVNFQNQPIRDKVMGKLIRSCFVPRPGHVLVEFDFGQLEVRVAACYNRDPVLIDYIKTGYDMHRDLASQCFLVEKDRVSKDVRYAAKNQFVFPEFYGSYFRDCAIGLWSAIDQLNLEVDGVPMRDHLRANGITELGDEDSDESFMRHICEVEEDFWGVRFKVYNEWKKEWYNQYLQRGWFDTLTGFREKGLYKRNDVINHPIQGSAFHCLLWCLIRLVQWTVKNKMQTKIVGQIHDSVLADVHKSELEDFVAKAQRLMVKDIRIAWDWIIVPLDVDVAIAEQNWYEKQEVDL